MPDAPPPDPLIDPDRLAELAATGMLDTPPEPAFDRLSGLASRLLRAPVALLSLVTDERQFFKSAVGLPEPWASARETPLSHSFCQWVVRTGGPLEVPDAAADARVCDNLAVRDLGVAAYLGVPIRTAPDAPVLGSFCAIDVRPREWSAADRLNLSDLAESVATEIALRLSLERRRSAEERLRSVVTGVPVILFALDAGGRVTLAEGRALDEIGVAPETLVGRVADELVAHLPALRDPLARCLAASFAPPAVGAADDLGSSWAAEFAGRHWELRCSPRPGGGLLGVAADVTERERMRRAALRREKLAAIGELAAGVAHEINNPLAVISGLAQLFGMHPDPSVRTDAGTMEAMVLRASRIVGALRSFARQDESAEHRPLDPAAVVKTTLHLAAPTLRQAGVDLAVELVTAPPSVLGDEVRIEQVLLNLLGNAQYAAARTSDPDGPRVRVGVCVAAGEAGGPGRVAITVSDNGPGIPPDVLPRIFDPFFTTKQIGEGTGLGLSICHGIVEAHGGVIGVDPGGDAPGRGATFTVTLPALG